MYKDHDQSPTSDLAPEDNVNNKESKQKKHRRFPNLFIGRLDFSIFNFGGRNTTVYNNAKSEANGEYKKKDF